MLGNNCEFVNKTGRVKVYDAPCLQSFDCWYGAITCLSSYMILGCFPCYHRSKAACYFVHCEFSGSLIVKLKQKLNKLYIA